MPRMRTIKPGFCTSDDIVALTIPCRLHFAMLWTYADDEGRGADNPRLIKAALWPLDDDVTLDDVAGWQAELAEHGRIVRYEVDGRCYFQIANFREHQKPQRRQASKIPGPEAVSDRSRTGTRVVREPSANAPVPVASVGEGRGDVGVEVDGGEFTTSSQSDPLPAQPAEPGEQGSGTGSRRARAFAALRLMAEGELTAARNRGMQVHSEEAFVAAALTAATRRHGSKANELAHQHAEWTAEQIAAHLRAPAASADDSVSPSAIYAHADRMRAAHDAESAEKGPADPNHVKSCTDAARADLARSTSAVSGARLLKAVQ